MTITETIFVDEAGNPGLPTHGTQPHRPFFVFGYVHCKDPPLLKKKLRRVLKKFHQNHKYPRELAELKFYLPYSDLIHKYGYTTNDLDSKYQIHMPEIRTKALSVIDQYSDGVFAAIVDKRKAVAYKWESDRLGNFIFAQTLFVNILNELQLPKPPLVIYDRGRLSPAKKSSFTRFVIDKEGYFAYKKIKMYTGWLSPPIEISSLSEAGIWAADLVAGSFYHKHEHKDSTYSCMLKKRIGRGERLYW